MLMCFNFSNFNYDAIELDHSEPKKSKMGKQSFRTRYQFIKFAGNTPFPSEII